MRVMQCVDRIDMREPGIVAVVEARQHRWALQQSPQSDWNGTDGVRRDDANFGDYRSDARGWCEVVQRVEDLEIGCIVQSQAFSRLREREVLEALS